MGDLLIESIGLIIKKININLSAMGSIGILGILSEGVLQLPLHLINTYSQWVQIIH